MELLNIAKKMSNDCSGHSIIGVVYPRYLFHRTKEENLSKILESDKLIAGTRSTHEDVRVSMSTDTDRKEFGGITLVIDADRLRNDYVVKEFDYDKSMGQYAYENEWFTDTDITNLSKYVVDIISDYDYSYDRLYCYSHINKDIARIISLPKMGHDEE